MPKILRLCPVLLLAACAARGGGGLGATCDPDGVEGLLGVSLAALTLPAALPVREIREGELVTADFDADRLNLLVDDGGVIQGAFCG